MTVRNRGAFSGLIALTLGMMGAPAFADDSLLDSIGKATGMISPTPDPPDFVKASRPKAEATPMPVFAPPEEPRSKVKSAAELKAMDADLDRASRRQGVKPSAKTKRPASKPTDP